MGPAAGFTHEKPEGKRYTNPRNFRVSSALREAAVSKSSFVVVGRAQLSARIPQIDWAGKTEGRGNARQTADSFFHPSGPPGFSYLILPKSLIPLSKLTRGAGPTPFHPGNPGSEQFDS